MATLTNNALNADGTLATRVDIVGGAPQWGHFAAGVYPSKTTPLQIIGVNVVDAGGNVSVVEIGPQQSITATLATPIPTQTQALITNGRLVVS